MSSQLERLISHLVDEGTTALALPRLPAQFAYDSEADAILNDIEHYPQAFVLACLCDRRGSAKQAWRVPYELLTRLRTLDVGQLAKLSEADWLQVVRNPTPIHRIPETMAKVLRLGVLQLSTVYDGTPQESGRAPRRAPPSSDGFWSSTA